MRERVAYAVKRTARGGIAMRSKGVAGQPRPDPVNKDADEAALRSEVAEFAASLGFQSASALASGDAFSDFGPENAKRKLSKGSADTDGIVKEALPNLRGDRTEPKAGAMEKQHRDTAGGTGAKPPDRQRQKRDSKRPSDTTLDENASTPWVSDRSAGAARIR